MVKILKEMDIMAYLGGCKLQNADIFKTVLGKRAPAEGFKHFSGCYMHEEGVRRVECICSSILYVNGFIN